MKRRDRTIQEILATVHEMSGSEAWAMWDVVDRLMKGGLPGQSMSDGRGGGQRDPGSDKTDLWLAGADRRHAEEVHKAFMAVRAARAQERRVLEVMSPEKAEAALKEIAAVRQCANCGDDVPRNRDKPMRQGRCEPCYRYRLRNGGERPARPADGTDESVA